MVWRRRQSRSLGLEAAYDSVNGAAGPPSPRPSAYLSTTPGSHGRAWKLPLSTTNERRLVTGRLLGPALSGGETDGEREVGGTETRAAARAIPRAPNRGVRGLQVSAVAAVGVGARWWLPSSQYPYPGQAQPHWTWALN
ncbi:hypothetical protein CPLU01_00137 [Colletotrichum plurivorum]|uniref:Uncharacterized protein n=1 Tax=Colletotrichum plurivorum TaxID=2175906 RepID=A0A8H6NT24_9PEZI|nr:hypothetical protein CPLU01_00137 [Colletotrichum plurivorum]